MGVQKTKRFNLFTGTKKINNLRASSYKDIIAEFQFTFGTSSALRVKEKEGTSISNKLFNKLC